LRRAPRCLLFVDDDDFGQSLTNELAGRDLDVVTVHAGDMWLQRGPGAYTIDPTDTDAYRRVLDGALGDQDVAIVHAWGVGGGADLDHTIDRSFFSALYLLQALASREDRARIRVTLVTDRMQVVRGDETIVPAKATLRGLRAVAALEHPDLPIVLVDIEAGGMRTAPMTARLADEVLSDGAEPVVAGDGCRPSSRCHPDPNRRLVSASWRTPPTSSLVAPAGSD
jgi:phthiocerol/phenolphthiocerol synthesis type-I polyketide synthase E